MDYLEILETTDHELFDKAILILKKSNIRYKTLNDYKLHPEKNHDFYSDSGSGAKILVLEKDLIKANHLLFSKQIKKQLHKDKVEFTFVEAIENYLNRIPFVRNWRLPFKLIISIFTLMFIPFFLLFYSSLENEYLPIQEYSCVRNIFIDGKAIEPSTTPGLPFSLGFCNERVLFIRDGVVYLPGFKTGRIKGQWKVDEEGDKLVIFNVDNFKEVYEGTFQIKRKWLSNYSIELISENKQIELVRT